MHLDDEQIQRLLHRELTAGAAAAVNEHLAGCSECRVRVAEAEREEAGLFTLLGQLDHAPPPSDIERIFAVRHSAAARWAAGIVLALVAGGMAYALPGSPVRSWMNGLFDRVPDQRATSVKAPAAGTEGGGSGIVVDAGDQLAIVFSDANGRGAARVSLTNDDKIVVRALNGTASFFAGIDRVVIENYDATTNFEVRIPRTARHVEILIGDTRVLVSRAAEVATAARAIAADTYLLPL